MRPLLYGRQRRANDNAPLPPEKKIQAAALYEKGESDAKIAYFCGCSKRAVLDWRRATGRKSNFERRESNE